MRNKGTHLTRDMMLLRPESRDYPPPPPIVTRERSPPPIPLPELRGTSQPFLPSFPRPFFFRSTDQPLPPRYRAVLATGEHMRPPPPGTEEKSEGLHIVSFPLLSCHLSDVLHRRLRTLAGHPPGAAQHQIAGAGGAWVTLERREEGGAPEGLEISQA